MNHLRVILESSESYYKLVYKSPVKSYDQHILMTHVYLFIFRRSMASLENQLKVPPNCVWG